MSGINTRYIEIDGWFFEIKAVRAIRAESYGSEYSAIANFNLYNDSAHIDGLMTRTVDDFSRKDHQAFEKFFNQIGVQNVSFDRYQKHGLKKMKKTASQNKNKTKPLLSLVR